MNSLESEDQETTDISDALIFEAARLESEYQDCETQENTETHPDATIGDAESIAASAKNETLEASVPLVEAPAKLAHSPPKSSDDVLVKRDTSSMPEKRKVESSSLKRKFPDDSLESLRPQPPDTKQLKKGFKIPKLSKQSAAPTAKSSVKSGASLTDEQKQFLEQLERDFSHRYTNEDEDYLKVVSSESSPPIVENFYCPPKRQFNRSEGSSSHYDRNNRNFSPYGHSHRPSYHKHSRDFSNNRDYPSSRDYSNNRDHRHRDYPDRDNPNYREYPSSRDDPSFRNHHQRSQERYRPPH